MRRLPPRSVLPCAPPPVGGGALWGSPPPPMEEWCCRRNRIHANRFTPPDFRGALICAGSGHTWARAITGQEESSLSGTRCQEEIPRVLNNLAARAARFSLGPPIRSHILGRRARHGGSVAVPRLECLLCDVDCPLPMPLNHLPPKPQELGEQVLTQLSRGNRW